MCMVRGGLNHRFRLTSVSASSETMDHSFFKSWAFSCGNGWMQTCPSWVLQIKIAVGTFVTKYLICLNDSHPWRTLYHHMKLLSAPALGLRVPLTVKNTSVGVSRCFWLDGRNREEYSSTPSLVKKDRFSPFSPTHAIKCYSESVKLDPLIFAVCGWNLF